MPRGGSRPGAGRKPTTKANAPDIPDAKLVKLEPLDLWLAVIRDPTQPMSARMDAAKQAAPYLYRTAGKGKREEQHEAAERASDKFGVPRGPKLVVSNR